jgi:hypothetical protein
MLGADPFPSRRADYSPTIFRSIGVTGTNTSLFTTGIFGVIKTIGGILWCFLIIDHFGRRGILLVGSIGGAVGMFVIAGESKAEVAFRAAPELSSAQATSRSPIPPATPLPPFPLEVSWPWLSSTSGPSSTPSPGTG